MPGNGTSGRYSPGWRLGLSRTALMGLAGSLLSSAAFAFVHPDALGPVARSVSQSLDATAQLHCLALNVYHEARSESDEGKFAVAQVTLNRVRSARYPNTICEVVWQRRQFSWTRDGRPDRPRNMAAWNRALWVAILARDFNPLNMVARATHYHADYVRPMWASAHRRIRQIGRHIFYEPLKYS
jgi:N-acetylmuramoyl-L-alanine amidase